MPSRGLSADDEEWVKDVARLSEALLAKLTALGGLSGESCGNIAHHLAESVSQADASTLISCRHY